MKIFAFEDKTHRDIALLIALLFGLVLSGALFVESYWKSGLVVFVIGFLCGLILYQALNDLIR